MNAAARVLRPTLVAAAVASCAATAVVLLFRLLEVQPGPLAAAVAFTPYLSVAGLAALAIVVWARQWALATLAATLVAATVATQLPLYVADGGSGEVRLRIATLNLLNGRADAGEVVRLVREEAVDVLALQEMPAEAVDRLHAAGLDSLLQHRYVATAPGVPGSGLWSRWPLREQRTLPGFVSANVLAVADVPGAGPVTLGSLHPAQPRILTSRRWASEQDRLHGELNHLPGTVVVAGDLNVTWDHAGLRRLLRTGYADAAEQAGAGVVRTWPHLRAPMALFGLDHVLSRGGLRATTAVVRPVPGSDHAALVVSLTGSPSR